MQRVAWDDFASATQRADEVDQVMDYLADWRQTVGHHSAEVQQSYAFSGDNRRALERFGRHLPDDMVNRVNIGSGHPKTVRVEAIYDSGRHIVFTFHGDTSQLYTIEHDPAAKEPAHRHNDLVDFERLKRVLFLCHPYREMSGRALISV